MLKVSVGSRLYPPTPLARQAAEEGVVSPEDDLLLPRFYIRPGFLQLLGVLISEMVISDRSGWKVSHGADQSAGRQKRNNSLQGVGGWYTTRHSTDREARPDPVFDCR
jgi:hypothetical protein